MFFPDFLKSPTARPIAGWFFPSTSAVGADRARI